MLYSQVMEEESLHEEWGGEFARRMKRSQRIQETHNTLKRQKSLNVSQESRLILWCSAWLSGWVETSWNRWNTFHLKNRWNETEKYKKRMSMGWAKNDDLTASYSCTFCYFHNETQPTVPTWSAVFINVTLLFTICISRTWLFQKKLLPVKMKFQIALCEL